MARTANTKKTSVQKTKPGSPDTLVQGGKDSNIELSEDDLKKVAGGLKLDYK